jgi:hypothetical protein
VSEDHAIARERIRSLGTRDWFLQQLVRLANESPANAGVPLTLCVKGMLVSGVLASGRAYFTECAQTVAARATHSRESDRRHLRDYIAAFGALYVTEADDAGPDSDEDAAKTLPEFIHLRGARIGGADTTAPTDWWRGRIAEVDGFFLGTRSDVTQ